jgi:hypothetical protein
VKGPAYSELYMEILGKTLDYLRSPPLFALACKDVLSDPPVEQNEFLVHGHGGTDLSCPDLNLETSQEILVALRTGHEIGHRSSTGLPDCSQQVNSPVGIGLQIPGWRGPVPDVPRRRGPLR